jgi:hypothetical protein
VISYGLALSAISTGQIFLLLWLIISVMVIYIGFEELGSGIILAGAISLILCVACIWGGMHIVRPAEVIPGDSFDTSEHMPIASLNAKDRTIGSGSFILGSGSMNVNGEPRFFFYKQVDGKYLTLDSIPAMGVLLSEDGETDPNVETIMHHKKGDVKRFDIWPGVIENWTETEKDRIVKNDTIIHVPKGTITLQNPFSAQVT